MVGATLMCLALNIYFEARNESLAGQFAVAEVTINRVNSKYYPDDVCKVVYQKGKSACAFSWTCDGISDTPYEKEAYRKSLSIAKRFLENEKYISVVGDDALFYHNTSVKPYWLSDVKQIKIVGNHVFYRKK
jgi:N-acetylmuramoyl-L-alanine amidase